MLARCINTLYINTGQNQRFGGTLWMSSFGNTDFLCMSYIIIGLII